MCGQFGADLKTPNILVEWNGYPEILRLSRDWEIFSWVIFAPLNSYFMEKKSLAAPGHFPCPDSTNLLQVDKGILQLWIKSVLGFLSIASFLRGGGERFFGFRQFLSQLFPARKCQR